MRNRRIQVLYERHNQVLSVDLRLRLQNFPSLLVLSFPGINLVSPTPEETETTKWELPQSVLANLQNWPAPLYPKWWLSREQRSRSEPNKRNEEISGKKLQCVQGQRQLRTCSERLEQRARRNVVICETWEANILCRDPYEILRLVFFSPGQWKTIRGF